MNERIKPASPDEKIVHYAKEWRQCDKQKVADRQDPEKSRAEFRARQQLRHVIDLAGEN